jgi:hypothetical protein
MKSDTTTTVLNYILAVMVILGVVFALLGMTRQRELRALTTNATTANAMLMRAQGLANDAAAFNISAKNPELARILQAVQPKTATAPAAK